jgi:hypothetical protein
MVPTFIYPVHSNIFFMLCWPEIIEFDIRSESLPQRAARTRSASGCIIRLRIFRSREISTQPCSAAARGGAHASGGGRGGGGRLPAGQPRPPRAAHPSRRVDFDAPCRAQRRHRGGALDGGLPAWHRFTAAAWPKRRSE